MGEPGNDLERRTRSGRKAMRTPPAGSPGNQTTHDARPALVRVLRHVLRPEGKPVTAFPDGACRLIPRGSRTLALRSFGASYQVAVTWPSSVQLVTGPWRQSLRAPGCSPSVAIARRGCVSLDGDDPLKLGSSGRGCSVARCLPSENTVIVRSDWVWLAALKVDDHKAPTWPANGVPKQIHLDLSVEDLDAAAVEAVQHASPSLSRPLNTGEFSSIPLAIPSASLRRPEPWAERTRRARRTRPRTGGGRHALSWSSPPTTSVRGAWSR